MRDVAAAIDEIRECTKHAALLHGVESLVTRSRPTVKRKRIETFIRNEYPIHIQDFSVAIALYKAIPELYTDIDLAPIHAAGDFFRTRINLSKYDRRFGNVNHSDKNRMLEAASFFTSLFGWTNRGDQIFVPVMPINAGPAAIGRLAIILNMELDELVGVLHEASKIRKAAMNAVTILQETDDYKYPEDERTLGAV